MRLLSNSCPPRVLAVYFRTLWNGWVTYERMKGLVEKRPCILGCGWEDDMVEHHCCCSNRHPACSIWPFHSMIVHAIVFLYDFDLQSQFILAAEITWRQEDKLDTINWPRTL